MEELGVGIVDGCIPLLDLGKGLQKALIQLFTYIRILQAEVWRLGTSLNGMKTTGSADSSGMLVSQAPHLF